MLSSRAKSSFARVTSRHYNYWPCTTTRTLVMMKRMGPSPANYPYPINRNKSLSTRSRARVEIRDGCCSSSTFSFRIGQRPFSSSSSNSVPTMPFRISEEIQEAVKNNGKAVVALESAIITHGMPYPDNIQTAMHLQNIIRQQVANLFFVYPLSLSLSVLISFPFPFLQPHFLYLFLPIPSTYP